MKTTVALPISNNSVSQHFGHAPSFMIVRVVEGQVQSKELATPPPHEPGVLPKWLAGLGVKVLLAGGIGQGAIQIFQGLGVEVICGVSGSPDEAIAAYLEGDLESSENACNH